MIKYVRNCPLISTYVFLQSIRLKYCQNTFVIVLSPKKPTTTPSHKTSITESFSGKNSNDNVAFITHSLYEICPRGLSSCPLKNLNYGAAI